MVSGVKLSVLSVKIHRNKQIHNAIVTVRDWKVFERYESAQQEIET